MPDRKAKVGATVTSYAQQLKLRKWRLQPTSIQRVSVSNVKTRMSAGWSLRRNYLDEQNNESLPSAKVVLPQEILSTDVNDDGRAHVLLKISVLLVTALFAKYYKGQSPVKILYTECSNILKRKKQSCCRPINRNDTVSTAQERTEYA